MRSEKIMRNLTLVQPQPCDEHSISNVPHKRSRLNSEMKNKKFNRNEKQGRSSNSKSSLDKVAEDIENILGKLDVFSAGDLKKSQPFELKIVQRQFFTTNNEVERKKEIPNKSSGFNTKGKPSAGKSSADNSVKSATVNKQTFEVFPKNITCVNSNSTNMVRKVPLTKSELQNFKHKIILNSNRVFKAPERIKIQDRENIANNVRRLIQAALKESEHKRKPPVIDVGNFIRQSLMSETVEGFPDTTKKNEKKMVDSNNETDLASNVPVKLKKLMKEGDQTNIYEIEKQQINKINHIPLQKENAEQVIKYSENDAGENKINICNPIVQTFKTLPNNGYTSRGCTRNLSHGPSRTTGSSTPHRKVPPSKSVVNMNVTQKAPPRVSSRHSSNKTITASNNLSNTKGISSRNSKVNESNKKTNPINKTKSNSTLRSINISPSGNVGLNRITNMSSRPSTASSNCTSTSKMSGLTRRGSAFEEMKLRLLSAPKRVSSSISSKVLNGKKISSHSYINATGRLNNPLQQLREEVNKAITEKKTFTLRGNHTAVRKALLKRGWVERFHITNTEKLESQMNWLRRRLLQLLSYEDVVETTPNHYQQLILFLMIDEADTWRKLISIMKHYLEFSHNLIQMLKYIVTSAFDKEVVLRNASSVNELQDMMHVKELNDICKRLIKSKLLVNHQVDLYWGPNYDSFTINPDHVKLTKINKFRRDVFSYTSKQGLCDAAKDAHWFNFPGLANIKHPRTYVLTRDGETNDFIKDFRHTAAISLLKWVMRSHETKDCKIVSSSGKVPLEVFQFAVNECCKLVIEANNEDIDQPLKQASEHEWNQFLEYYYKILHIGNHFKLTSLETEETIIDKSEFLLKKLSPHYPHIRMDGTMNIWILKPAVGSQGKGIHICRTLQYILKTVKNNNNIKYIAQKYIERPLLIFNTKFDIRQWFLISSALPLTIWMYKECYLRFSSQTYNLRKLHESIHLTNNSVQQRYQNTSRDLTLPNYNMWDSQQFKNYLSNIGFPEVYNEVTYKGMKECIIGAVLIHQDKIDKRKNSFELYGADFMLTEDFQPWLIEINSSPALYASTPVTSRMCPQVLEDTIKVVVDYATNPKAKTGNFELIYKQENLSDKSNVCVKDLKVSGKPLPRNYFYSDEEKKENIGAVMDKLQKDLESPMKEPETVNRGVRETLENLLRFIHNEKKRRQKTKLIAKGTDPINPIDKSGKGMRSSTTCTNRTKSIASLKSQWDQLSGNGSFSVAKEDVSMIDKALSMLKETQNGEIIGYLLEVIEKILTRTQQNRVDS